MKPRRRWRPSPNKSAESGLLRTVQAKHGAFTVDTRDEFIAAPLASTGEYSEEELALLTAHTLPDADILVVGAHIGAFVVPLSRVCRKLVAVEANPSTFELLKLNVLQNRLENVALRNGAAAEHAGLVQFLCGTRNSGGSKRVPVKARDDYYYDNPEQIEVQTFRLDDIEGEFHLIHMDIEGSEVFALRGAQRLLGCCKYLSVEFISHHLTHVAGVTVDEWLEPIEPHFNAMLLPGSTALNRPHIVLERADWREMLQGIVDAGVGIEEIIFWSHA